MWRGGGRLTRGAVTAAVAAAKRPAAHPVSASRRGAVAVGAVGHSGHLDATAAKAMAERDSAAAGRLSASDRYLFDLNGFLVLRGVFSPETIGAANAAIDAHMDQLHERTGKLRTSALYGRHSPNLAGDGRTGRSDMGGMLGWAAPHCEPFREVLAHPRLAPLLIELLGEGYRLDHSPLLLHQRKGSEGHTLHGGAVTEAGGPAWPLQYQYAHGQIRTALLTVCMQLTDTGPTDGGFCVVPGSHKANFPTPPALADCAALTEHVRQPTPQAGDALVFTEAVLHGTLPWTSDRERRTVIYRFAPAGLAYGRGYMPWPDDWVEGATEAQRAVLEPPYHPRMNRPYVGSDGEHRTPRPREGFKVEFDERVFGRKYF